MHHYEYWYIIALYLWWGESLVITVIERALLKNLDPWQMIIVVKHEYIFWEFATSLIFVLSRKLIRTRAFEKKDKQFNSGIFKV